MAISPRFMQELRDRLTLSDIVGRRVKLTRVGREFKGCCPFHREKTPSFYVNDEKQFYHCFGCGAHGDAVGFVMQHDNQSFIDAVEGLAALAGLEVPQMSRQDVERSRQEKSLFSLMDDATGFFEEQLRQPANRDAHDYLLGRGMGEETIAAFRLGYAPADDQAVRTHLRAKGYEDSQMIEAGVLRPSSRGGAAYSFFRDRIMFPVADKRGRVVAFGGRVLPDHLRPPVQGGNPPPKYINSSETPLFHKGRMLYGESRARQAAADGQSVIVVEGYMDVMACFAHGFRGAVAPLGTALTEEQIVALWKIVPGGTKVPVLCFDGDVAGRRAAARAGERFLPLLKPDHSALIAFLPEGHDPDSLLRGQGQRAFQAVLDTALPLADFLWTHHAAGRSFATPEARAGLAKTLENEAARIADRDVQQYYRQAFRDLLFRAFGPQKKGKGRQGAGTVSAPVRLSRPGGAENLTQAVLLATVINHPEIIESVEEELGCLHIENERLDLLRQAVLNHCGDAPDLDRDRLWTHLEEGGFGKELEALLNRSVYVHASFARPEGDGQGALAGWRETLDFLRKKADRGELKEAGRKLAGDFSEENEKRVMALHGMREASGD